MTRHRLYPEEGSMPKVKRVGFNTEGPFKDGKLPPHSLGEREAAFLKHTMRSMTTIPRVYD